MWHTPAENAALCLCKSSRWSSSTAQCNYTGVHMEPGDVSLLLTALALTGRQEVGDIHGHLHVRGIFSFFLRFQIKDRWNRKQSGEKVNFESRINFYLCITWKDFHTHSWTFRVWGVALWPRVKGQVDDQEAAVSVIVCMFVCVHERRGLLHSVWCGCPPAGRDLWKEWPHGPQRSPSCPVPPPPGPPLPSPPPPWDPAVSSEEQLTEIITSPSDQRCRTPFEVLHRISVS